MSTVTAHISPGTARRTALFLVAVALAAPPFSSHPSTVVDPELFEGRAPTAGELKPSVEAAFPRQSYAPGETATLVFFNSAPGVRVQLLQPADLPLRERLVGEVGERRAAPEGERLAEQCRPSVVRSVPRLRAQPLEPCEVDLSRIDAELIARRLRGHHPRA